MKKSVRFNLPGCDNNNVTAVGEKKQFFKHATVFNKYFSKPLTLFKGLTIEFNDGTQWEVTYPSKFFVAVRIR